MKRLLWIMAALAIVLGACSNATDSARAIEEDPPLVGLDIGALTSLDDIYFSQRESINVKLGLAGASSFSIDPSGSLPSGLSMDSTGLITGTADVVEADTTANFTVVSDTSVEKPITWTVKAPRTQKITASGDWTAPSDLGGYSTSTKISLQVLMAGGGGGGGKTFGNARSGGGGGGQVVEDEVLVAPGETISVGIGGGGAGGYIPGNNNYATLLGLPGGTTSFGSYLSAAGGGGGAAEIGPGVTPPGGHPGGASPAGTDGTGASGSGKNGKISTNKYEGGLITLGGGGAGTGSGTNRPGGAGGGGTYHSTSTSSPGAPNTGGGGAGGVNSNGAAGGTGVVYVNY